MHFATALSDITPLLPPAERQIHMTLLRLLDFIRVRYSAASFRHDRAFANTKLKQMIFDLDDYNDKKAAESLLEIQKSLYNFHRIYKKHTFDAKHVHDYVKFMHEMGIKMATILVSPISCIPHEYHDIITRYKKQKPPKKSSKINYDALSQMFPDVVSVLSS